MADLIDRQAAIDVEGIDEQIRCEMCRNPMHTDRGCDGNCKYDEKLYERIMQILDKRIRPLPSAQPRIIRCKDCKHRPSFRYDDDGDKYVEGPRYQETLKNGLTVTFEDETCPCVNGWDFYYSYIPKDDWYCANGERREEE